MIQIRILGMAQTLARFGRAAAVSEVAAEAAAGSAAMEIAEGARSRVPVDTGVLLDSIEVNGEGVSVTAPYALYVEYSQPFVRPAMDEAHESPARVAAEIMRRA